MPPPLPESEWDRRRAVAATCTSVDELSHKLNLESRMSTAMLQKHGCFVLCPICRRAPARELVTLRQHDITGAEPQPRFANQPGRRWVCASCAKALPTMPAKSHTVHSYLKDGNYAMAGEAMACSFLHGIERWVLAALEFDRGMVQLAAKEGRALDAVEFYPTGGFSYHGTYAVDRTELEAWAQRAALVPGLSEQLVTVFRLWPGKRGSVHHFRRSDLMSEVAIWSKSLLDKDSILGDGAYLGRVLGNTL